jgi:hypothetical protein
MASVYKINKGVNRPIEFKGLKAQYIWYLGAGLVLLLVVFATLYLVGVNMIICLMLILIAGTALFMSVYRLSRTFGQHGLLKMMAKRAIPDYLRAESRRLFLNLKGNI